MNNPIEFFKSLFKNKKTTLTGKEVLALQYLHPEKGAINTGDYCTTQDIANLSPPYTPPIGLSKQYNLRTSDFEEISNNTGVAIINGTSGLGPYHIYLPSSPYEGMEFYMCSNVSPAYGISTPSYDAIISYTDLTSPTNLITVNQLETLNFKYTSGMWVVNKIQNYTITSDTVVTDEITEKNAGVGVTIEGVLLKDGKINNESVSFAQASGAVTATGTLSSNANVLFGRDFYEINDIEGGGVNGVALAASLSDAVLGKEVYIANTSGSNIKVYGSLDGVLQICAASYNSVSASFSMATNKVSCFKYVGNGKWLQIIII